MQIVSLKELSNDLNEFIINEFNEHSLKHVGHDGSKMNYCFVAKEEDKIRGLISGKIFYGVLQIKNFIVIELARGQGLGRKLLNKTLEFGLEKSCEIVTVETLSFQAVEFYKLYGFKEDFVRTGYGEEISFHYMSKKLN